MVGGGEIAPIMTHRTETDTKNTENKPNQTQANNQYNIPFCD